MRYDAARAQFDIDLSVVGMRRIGSYARQSTYLDIECANQNAVQRDDGTWGPHELFMLPHKFYTRTISLGLWNKSDSHRNPTLWDHCPRCSEIITDTINITNTTILARQRGYDAIFHKRGRRWEVNCDTCGGWSAKNYTRVLANHYACPHCPPDGNTIWCAEDGVYATLWIGREPVWVTETPDINVYPVFGEMVDGNFEIDSYATEAIVKLCETHKKELTSKARSKAVKMYKLAEIEMSKQFTILIPENHKSWTDTPLTRGLLKDIDTNYFWDVDPPVIQLTDIGDPVPVAEAFELTVDDDRIPDIIRDNNSHMQLYKSALAGDVVRAYKFGDLITSGATAKEEVGDGGTAHRFYYQPDKRGADLQYGRWSLDIHKAILDAALAAAPILYGGRYNKNFKVKEYVDPTEQLKDPIG